ncbi:MAG: outer membrane protein assembly factor [Rhodospirillales bacterium]|nr:MAG: outer membrane protein assembly factor [Rhodospirillales bacterium]
MCALRAGPRRQRWLIHFQEQVQNILGDRLRPRGYVGHWLIVAATVALAAVSAIAVGAQPADILPPGVTPMDVDPLAAEPLETDATPAHAPFAEDIPGLDYTLTITGTEDPDLLRIFDGVSLLRELRDRPPRTFAGLLRRIEEDLDRFRTVLRSEGFYGGTVDFEVDDEADPIEVRITVSPGEPFGLTRYDVTYVSVNDVPPPTTPSLEDLGLSIGMRARAARVVTAERRLIDHLINDARPFAQRTDRRAVVDHRDRSMTVDVFVDPGPPAGFGPATFDGLDRTKLDYVEQWIDWNVGEPFRQDSLDDVQSGLVGTGLFTSVVVTHADALDADGNVPVTVSVIEDKPRSIGGSIGWSTDRGFGGRAFWEHRNFFGRDEDFRLSADVDQLEQGGRIEFVRPNFKRLDRRLFATAQASRVDTDAFEGFTGSLETGLEWPLGGNWFASAGGLIEYSNLDDGESRQSSVLGGIPLRVSYRGADDDLDPTKGVRFDLGLTPFAGQSGTATFFHLTEIATAAYYPIDQRRRYVLAGRTRIASIVGEETSVIPANRRLYTGGAGSIRGFGFQLVGPLDAANDPIGGRSALELTGELRARIWGNFAVVPFVAAGNAYDRSLPDFSEPLRWAAGLGLRYHTPIGPVRLDVAFPVNRRPDVDDRFQFYISIGQAF